MWSFYYRRSNLYVFRYNIDYFLLDFVKFVFVFFILFILFSYYFFSQFFKFFFFFNSLISFY
ncbi:hypothetical protein EPJ84_03860 [Brachyspira aalborgi]|uniref:Uncharacterized protein n=1 Tax=Brachyspira aalborgi TaxID=29522 RepID=A0A5C8FQY3_9SPIR|nr:hypothetical protein EPJ84_03860 [Brachyspira aalborgi]